MQENPMDFWCSNGFFCFPNAAFRYYPFRIACPASSQGMEPQVTLGEHPKFPVDYMEHNRYNIHCINPKWCLGGIGALVVDSPRYYWKCSNTLHYVYYENFITSYVLPVCVCLISMPQKSHPFQSISKARLRDEEGARAFGVLYGLGSRWL